MNELVHEIAKQLPLECQFICKLLSKRLYKYVRIYRLKKYDKLNDERIDLFPDLRELVFKYSKIQSTTEKLVGLFDPNKIAKLQLVSFKYYDNMDFYHHINIDFKFLKNMRTLKQLYLIEGESYDFFKIDDILATLDLEYIDQENYYGDHYIDFQSDSLKHMKHLKASNFLSNNDPDILADSLRFIYMNNSISVNNGVPNFDEINQILRMNLHTMELSINSTESYPWYSNRDDRFFDLMLLKDFKLHKLILDISVKHLDFTFIQNMKLYELQILRWPLMGDDCLPSIKLIKKIGVKRLIIKGGATKYSDEQLKQLDHGVYVKQEIDDKNDSDKHYNLLTDG